MSDVVYNLAVNDAEYRRGLKRTEAETLGTLGRIGQQLDAKTANARKFAGSISSAAGAFTSILGAASAATVAFSLLTATGNAFAASQERAAAASIKQRDALVQALQASTQLVQGSRARIGLIGPGAASVAGVNERFSAGIADLQARQVEIEAEGLTPEAIGRINTLRDEAQRLEAQRRQEVGFARQQGLFNEFITTRSAEAGALTAEGRGREAQRLQLEIQKAQRLNQIRTQAEPGARAVLEDKLNREFRGRGSSLERGFAREDSAGVAAARIAALQAEGKEIAALRAAERERNRQAIDGIEDKKRAGAAGTAELEAAEARRHAAEMENIDREAAGRAAAKRRSRALNTIETRRLRGRVLGAEGDDAGAQRIDIATERLDLLRQVQEDETLSPAQKRERFALINRLSAAQLAGLDADPASQGRFLSVAGGAGGAASRVFAVTESEKVNVQKQNTDALKELTNVGRQVVDGIRNGIVGVFG